MEHEDAKRQKLFWPIEKLHEWEKNPRSITKEGFRRLKAQIQKLGQYKPLIITADGTVLGGNMRLKAYRELGIKDVWVSIVYPKDENEALEYSLSDNDRAGYYDHDLLANLIPNYDIEWGKYAIDLKESVDLDNLLQQYSEDGVEEREDNIKNIDQITIEVFWKDGYHQHHEFYRRRSIRKLWEKIKNVVGKGNYNEEECHQIWKKWKKKGKK